MNQAALHQLLASQAKKKGIDELFELRLATNLTLIKDFYLRIYPDGGEKHFSKLLKTLYQLFAKRPQHLRDQDARRIKNGNWYLSEKMVGMQLYVDHFNKDLKGLEDKLDYLQDLGITFLHLMPITTRPKGENDGGYAVNNYTKIDSRYGSKKELQRLTKKMSEKGMYLMLDFVENHTSNEHAWAKKA